MKKVALIFGGTSTERLVSVASAQNVVKYFNNPDIYFIDITGHWFPVEKDELLLHTDAFQQEFKPQKSLIANSLMEIKKYIQNHNIFISLHGTEGEDGSYQKFFEDHKISFTGSGSLSSHLCFNKPEAKLIAQKNHFPLAQQLVLDFNSSDSIKLVSEFFKKFSKIVLKPIANGSSFGLHIVDSEEKLNIAIQSIKNESDLNYLCEEFILGRELTVGVYQINKDLRALCPSEVILDQGSHFDYQGKYLGKGSTEITPADLNLTDLDLCQKLAIKAHQIFNCYGYSRTDMILTAKGPVFLETNTLPGLTKASFYPQQLAAEKIEFQKFIDQQLMLAESRFN